MRKGVRVSKDTEGKYYEREKGIINRKSKCPISLSQEKSRENKGNKVGKNSKENMK